MPNSYQQMQTDHNAFYVQPQFSADQGQYPAGFVDPSAYYHQHGMAPVQPSPLTAIATPPASGGVYAGPGQIKWSRIALLIVGVAVVGFAVINLVGSSSSAVKAAKKTNATMALAPAPAESPMMIKAPPLKAAVHHKKSAASRARHAHQLQKRHNAAGNGLRSTPVAGSPGEAMGGMPMPGSRRSATGGARMVALHGRRGRAGAQALPYTGASTWIAAVIGLLMLAAGVFVQYKALAIGDTAAMYRRGPLLRPFWLVALTIRNAPHAAAYVARRMPEIARAYVRACSALDARGVESDYVSARRS